MPDFSGRSTRTEEMDDLEAGGPDLLQALRELDAINYLLGGNYVTLRGLADLVDPAEKNTYRIVDLGCGSGDMLRRIRQMLNRKDVDALLTGIDANPHVVAYAEKNTPADCRIVYEAQNILSPAFSQRAFDIVTATLFFHHFSTEQLIEILRMLRRQVTRGLVINDIHRHWFAYYAIKALTAMFSKSPMVRNDGPVSVLRAFTRRELVHILREAGFRHYRIRWCWAFRWQVVALAEPG